jgi:hypothetical protein
MCTAEGPHRVEAMVTDRDRSCQLGVVATIICTSFFIIQLQRAGAERTARSRSRLSRIRARTGSIGSAIPCSPNPSRVVMAAMPRWPNPRGRLAPIQPVKSVRSLRKSGARCDQNTPNRAGGHDPLCEGAAGLFPGVHSQRWQYAGLSQINRAPRRSPLACGAGFVAIVAVGAYVRGGMPTSAVAQAVL